MTKHRLLLSAVPLAAALALTGCGSSGGQATAAAPPLTPAAARTAPRDPRPAHAAPRPTGPVITVRTSQYGPMLADRNNRTIYLFTHDRSATSTCYGPCAAAWPPVLTRGAPGRADGLAGALGTTRRHDGSWQVTYDGHPLYYYVGDTTPGEILCQNVDEFGGTWLVLSPRGQAVR